MNIKTISACFIPVLTTSAGSSLTMNNWQETGVTHVAYDLLALLMKPGIGLLSNIPTLAAYVGWNGPIILNASMPGLDNTGGYTVRSNYDGSRTHYTREDILSLITKLKPDIVILPQDETPDDEALWQYLPSNVMPFFQLKKLPKFSMVRSYGVYLHHNINESETKLLEQCCEYKMLPCYVAGELSLSLMKQLSCAGVKYLTSNIPASDACNGILYHEKCIIDLKDHAFRMQFEVIDSTCRCTSCTKNLTMAYLNHLLEHTPLLCHRLLIEHNVHVCLKDISY